MENSLGREICESPSNVEIQDNSSVKECIVILSLHEVGDSHSEDGGDDSTSIDNSQSEEEGATDSTSLSNSQSEEGITECTSISTASSNSYVMGGATMSSSSGSGSGGSTKYMLEDARRLPSHPQHYTVMSMGRCLDGRLHHQRSIRTPTPETSRYEPNFMLGPSSSEFPKYEPRYMIRSTSPRTSKKSESRFMVRPKIHHGTGSINNNKSFENRYMVHPATPELPRVMESKCGLEKGHSKDMITGSLYDPYWHIPRPTLWCSHKGCVYDAQPCKDCQWKQEECSSTCSSINPPPTFTAMDNYRPVRPRPKSQMCSCGIIFAITTIFSLFVLLLIAAFIIYIEMVLKHQTANVTDRM